ncbi:hypothetical protein ACOBQX_12170 [Actinokineospora sp. G85]|uniref:hypothetical protein n=1 Tax=Actinokineospora sp. G85 TaxID=3406626 RepID=UPI003C71056D
MFERPRTQAAVAPLAPRPGGARSRDRDGLHDTEPVGSLAAFVLRTAVLTANGWVVDGAVARLCEPLSLPAAGGVWVDPGGRLWLDTLAGLARASFGGEVALVLPGRTRA